MSIVLSFLNDINEPLATSQIKVYEAMLETAVRADAVTFLSPKPKVRSSTRPCRPPAAASGAGIDALHRVGISFTRTLRSQRIPNATSTSRPKVPGQSAKDRR
jgi:hypothetical protein